MLAKLEEVLFELLRLGFFEALGYHHQEFLKLDPLDPNMVNKELIHIECLEGWVSRAWLLNVR